MTAQYERNNLDYAENIKLKNENTILKLEEFDLSQYHSPKEKDILVAFSDGVRPVNETNNVERGCRSAVFGSLKKLHDFDRKISRESFKKYLLTDDYVKGMLRARKNAHKSVAQIVIVFNQDVMSIVKEGYLEVVLKATLHPRTSARGDVRPTLEIFTSFLKP